LAELNVQLKTLGLEKALLVPANPALGRTMVNGIYYYNDHPIHLSSFSKDPEFAIKSSKVLEMLRANGGNVKLTNKSVSVEGPGVYVGEAANEGDLHHWANIHEKDMLAVGGSGFFRALLAHHLPATKLGLKKTVKKPGKLSLFVCGSTFSKSRANIKHIHTNGGPVNYIPVVQDPVEDDSYQEWIDETVSLIKSNCTAIIAINESAFSELTVSALELREKTAHLVSGILKKVKVNELYIEGGSTAAAVIRKLGYTIFTPVEELAPGVIRMAINGNPKLCVTVKPGSYNWPDNVWKF
jgi:uncharacterized protein YgbK (DUF1537 family)